MIGLADPSLDEIWGVLILEASIKDIWISSFADMHPPFYFLFLKAVSYLTGGNLSLGEIRIVSLFWGLLSVFTTYKLAKLLLSKKALKLALILSVNLPSMIWSFFYGRYYSFLIFLTSLTILVFVLYLKKPEFKKLLTLFFLSLVGLYTHYYFAFVIISFLLFLLTKVTYKNLFHRYLVSLSLLFLLFVPALFFLSSLPKFKAYTFSGSLLKIPASFIANITSFQTLVFLNQTLNMASISYLIFFLLIILSILWLGIKKTKSQFRLLLILMTFLPFSLGVVSYLFKLPIFGVNSLLIFLPAYILFLSNGLASSPRFLKVLFFIFLGLSFVPFTKSFKMASEFKEPFDYVGENLQMGDLLIHTDLYTLIGGRYFLKDSQNYGGISSIYNPYIEKSLGYEILPKEEVKKNSRIWYFEPHFYNIDEAKSFKRSLDRDFKIVTSRRFEKSKINIYLFENENVRNKKGT